jgi:protein disulfide-isomerase A6
MKLIQSYSLVAFYAWALLWGAGTVVVVVHCAQDDIKTGTFSNYDVPLLTWSNYDELTASKTVFIKFFAPWCSHCKRIAKDWEQLAKDWAGSDVGLVASVDCTDHKKGGKKLCNELHIESFPTLMYGRSFQLEEYKGERSYADLAAFAEETLVPECSVVNLELCDAASREAVEKYLKMDEKKLKEMIQEEEKKIEQADKTFEETIDALSKKYEVAEAARQQIIDKVMKGDLGLMRQVRSARERKAQAEKETNDEL